MPDRLFLWLGSIVLLLAALSRQAFALPADSLPQESVVPPDVSSLNIKQGQSLARRFAVPLPVSFSVATHGVWSDVENGEKLWQLRIRSAGAASLSLAMTDVALGKTGELRLVSVDGSQQAGPFDQAGVMPDGQLWTPMLLAEEVILEVQLSVADAAKLALSIVELHYGYRSAIASRADGDCHLDVVCTQGQPWRTQIRAVGLLTVGGVQSCSGVLVNNTARDGRPLFLTADHCYKLGDSAVPLAPSSSVVYWNHESSSCGGTEPVLDASMSTSGATMLAQWARNPLPTTQGTDFALIELAAMPLPAFDVHYAGWDRRNLAPADGVAIHHAAGEEKLISFENDGLLVTRDSQSSSNINGNYLRVGDWDLGSSEPGSSGAGLFNSAQLVVGQLSHGNAECGGSSVSSNQGSDWFGRLAVAWEGGGTARNRLRDHLDPESCGVQSLSGMNPGDMGSLCPDGPIDDGSPASGGGEGNTGSGGGGAIFVWLWLLLAGFLPLSLRRSQ